jgi:threonine/homoserine/homoserine lactone efflux protein
MTVYEVLGLLALGFTVGLSGALIPGPLLVYTINESLKKGKWTGLKVILGHAAVEVIVVVLLAAGLAEFISSQKFVSTVSLLGGGMLILLGANSLREGEIKTEPTKKTSYNLIAGGSFFTAFNPSFPLWWATAGLTLLLKGFKLMQYLGVGLVVVGHWIADFGWYITVSHAAASKTEMLFEKGWYKEVKVILSLMLMGIGVYFIASA